MMYVPLFVSPVYYPYPGCRVKFVFTHNLADAERLADCLFRLKAVAAHGDRHPV
jgi:hypothetical protein